MEIFNFRKVDGRSTGQLVVEDLARLNLTSTEVMAFAERLEPECALLLIFRWLRTPPHVESLKARNKRGHKADKKRRKKQ